MPAQDGQIDGKKRHGICELAVTGQQLSADHAATATHITEFADVVITGDYSPYEVYNTDETGLHFKALPKKSLTSKKEECAPGFKMSKERVTVLARSNAMGTDKLPLMVIGNSIKQRAFINLNTKSLPVYYRSQRRAWINATLFKKWFETQFVPALAFQ